jgi:hypothetical protein
MIGTDVLLFPETGEPFVRCLKTAALFSERIWCFSSCAPKIVKDLFKAGDANPESLLVSF